MARSQTMATWAAAGVLIGLALLVIACRDGVVYEDAGITATQHDGILEVRAEAGVTLRAVAAACRRVQQNQDMRVLVQGITLPFRIVEPSGAVGPTAPAEIIADLNAGIIAIRPLAVQGAPGPAPLTTTVRTGSEARHFIDGAKLNPQVVYVPFGVAATIGQLATWLDGGYFTADERKRLGLAVDPQHGLILLLP